MKSKILILVGLPGSGKTFFAKKMLRKMGVNKVNHIDIDFIKQLSDKSTKEIIKKRYKEYSEYNIIDGLFLNTNDVIEALSLIPDCANLSIEIHYWTPDREVCLWNDISRREVSSETTIKYAEIEEIDIDKIKRAFNTDDVKFVRHQVIKKPVIVKKMDEVNLCVTDEKYLCSEYWSLGGSYGNCWDSLLRPVAPETSPTDFKEFDELLEHICSDITFLQYKRIYSECVEIEEKFEHDYYGGGVTYARFRCDLEKLNKMLIDRGIIEE